MMTLVSLYSLLRPLQLHPPASFALIIERRLQARRLLVTAKTAVVHTKTLSLPLLSASWGCFTVWRVNASRPGSVAWLAISVQCFLCEFGVRGRIEWSGLNDLRWVAYSVPRQSLHASRWSHQKVNVSHQLIVEHHRIPARQDNLSHGQNELYSHLHFASSVSYKVIMFSVHSSPPSTVFLFCFTSLPIHIISVSHVHVGYSAIMLYCLKKHYIKKINKMVEISLFDFPMQHFKLPNSLLTL